jgi:hypothetical protein
VTLMPMASNVDAPRAPSAVITARADAARCVWQGTAPVTLHTSKTTSTARQHRRSANADVRLDRAFIGVARRLQATCHARKSRQVASCLEKGGNRERSVQIEIRHS